MESLNINSKEVLKKKKTFTYVLASVVLIYLILMLIQYVLIYINKNINTLNLFNNWIGIEIMLQVIFTPLAFIASIILLIKIFSKNNISFYSRLEKLLLCIISFTALTILVVSLTNGISKNSELQNYTKQQNQLKEVLFSQSMILFDELSQNPNTLYRVTESNKNFGLLLNNYSVYVVPEGSYIEVDWRPLFQQYVLENLQGKMVKISLPSKEYFSKKYSPSDTQNGIIYFPANAYIDGNSVFELFIEWKNNLNK